MMSLTPTHRRWRSWWWVFGALIALPATALALLGASAIRADELERRRQLIEQRQQFARLADTALARSFDAAAVAARTQTAIEDSSGTASSQAIFFVISDHQALTFPGDRVYIATSGGAAPRQAVMTLPPETRALVSQAQAAEAQGRLDDARDAYERLRPSTELGRWAAWRLEALSSTITEVRGTAPVTFSTIGGSTAVSPSAIPVAVLASAMAEHAEPAARSRFVPLLQATLSNLRAGRWWLALEQRRFYDAEVRRWLAQAQPGAAFGPDTRLDVLADLAASVQQSFAQGEHLQSGTRMVECSNMRIMLRWQAPRAHMEGWSGVAIPEVSLTALLAQTLDPLVKDQPFQVALSDGPLHVWGSRAADASQLRVSLQSLPGWALIFTDLTSGNVANAARFRSALNYARVAVPLIVLACGLLMTVSIMRRELVLARLQSAFLSAVTHEFKSPITAVRLLLERMSSGHLAAGDSAARYYDAVGVEVDRLDSLVNRLLEAQRLHSGQKRYAPVPIALPTLVDEAVAGMRPQAEAKRIVLSTNTAPDIPIVHVDAESVSDAVRNLVDNAIKYSPSGTTVEIELRRDRDRVAMSVADEGVGVDADEVSRLFEPFYRGRRGDRTNVHGTGLGLALVKATVEAHGGSITVTARAPQGSCFTVFLPIASSPISEVTL